MKRNSVSNFSKRLSIGIKCLSRISFSPTRLLEGAAAVGINSRILLDFLRFFWILSLSPSL